MEQCEQLSLYTIFNFIQCILKDKKCTVIYVLYITPFIDVVFNYTKKKFYCTHVIEAFPCFHVNFYCDFEEIYSYNYLLVIAKIIHIRQASYRNM